MPLLLKFCLGILNDCVVREEIVSAVIVRIKFKIGGSESILKIHSRCQNYVLQICIIWLQESRIYEHFFLKYTAIVKVLC